MSNLHHIKVINPGLLTTIQSTPNYNYIDHGVPSGGPIDSISALYANWLVGNERYAPVIEMTSKGISIYLEHECCLAVTGGQVKILLNNSIVFPMYNTVSVPKNSTLFIKDITSGYRSYLAVSGKILYNEYSPYSSKAIVKNSIIEFIKRSPSSFRNIDYKIIPSIDSKVHLRVTKGPEYDLFNTKILDLFFETWYKATQTTDRMGIRLNKSLAGYENQTEMLSSGILPGTIQIDHKGTPTILLNDAQTVGGYPRIANVIHADYSKLGQIGPNTKINFTLVTADAALKANQLQSENISLFYPNK